MTRTRTPHAHRGDAGSSTDKLRPRTRYNTRSLSRRLTRLGGPQEGRRKNVTDDEFWEKMEVLKSSDQSNEEPSGSLVVKNVNFNKQQNGIQHKTDSYEITGLVVRRGQPVNLTIEFDRNIDVKVDSISIQFVFGNQPKESKGTLLRTTLDLSGKESVFGSHQWKVKVQEVKASNVEITVTAPVSASIGRYGVFVETVKLPQGKRLRYEAEDDIIILFNPWSPQDVVYMEDELEREEYVLNEHGRIWVGSAYANSGRPWYFGQFENPVLEAALTLMDEAEISDSARNSPIVFVRALSSWANSMDNDGVLEGRWTETFPKDCTVPWSWTGSVKILKAFMVDKKPVRFGQCWVFSGLITSLLRSLGIPTRSVTNFESAHDTDSSMTIDMHFDEDGEPKEWLNDSVWNFHVWNESYFKRLDLPDGYDGWQAHDSTPQEMSEGVMRCGPAPVKAIKEGHVYLNYDVPFIFSEVNGDRINWMVLEDGTMQFMDVDGKSVGKNISTKAVMSNDRHDITDNYKYPEGSEEERRVVAFVNRFSCRADPNLYKSDIVRDVVFEMKSPESTMLGDLLKFTVDVNSDTGEKRTIRGCLSVVAMFYTGVPWKRIKSEKIELELPASAERQVDIEIAAKEYIDKLQPEASVQVYASFKVLETGQQFARTKSFSLQKPSLTIEVPKTIKAKKQATGVLSFNNVLPIDLTNAKISMEGSSLLGLDDYEISSIKSSQRMGFNFIIDPKRTGRQEIHATLTTDQISGIDGSVEIHVLP